ncbi:MAG: transcriptional regulator with XRE-family HTH domain [Flammeovirgaceae bacterium]|jgi:transcriptional regulator with XRE-family HTH domain
MGKSYNTINEYARNKRQPKLEILMRIAEILNMEAKELIEFALKQGYKIPIDKKAILKVYYSSRTPNETINQLKKLGIPLEKTNRNAG